MTTPAECLRTSHVLGLQLPQNPHPETAQQAGWTETRAVDALFGLVTQALLGLYPLIEEHLAEEVEMLKSNIDRVGKTRRDKLRFIELTCQTISDATGIYPYPTVSGVAALGLLRDSVNTGMSENEIKEVIEEDKGASALFNAYPTAFAPQKS